MRALVTGATGFLGSCLTRRLLREGAAVAVLCRRDRDPWRIRDLLPGLTLLEGGMADLAAADAALRTQVERFAPDTVFHLAWHGVANEYRNAAAQVEQNLAGSLGLVQLAAECGCRSFVGVGSQAEYGPRNRALSEQAPTEPTTLYGAAKLAAYFLCRQVAAQAGIRFAWVRLFSAYGPMDNAGWMLPYLIRSLLEGKRPSLTAGEQLWDYVYVDDAADAVCRVGGLASAEGVFNLGSGRAVALRSLIEQTRDLIDPALSLGFGEVPYRPDQVFHLQADVSKLARVVGWKPQTDLNEGLRRTVEYYRFAALPAGAEQLVASAGWTAAEAEKLSGGLEPS